MHNISLILTLTYGLSVALCCGYLTNLIKLSPIVGYLIAGVIVGPYTPGFIADQHIAEQFAEVGVILLMFGVGLHFHLEDLLAVKKIAIPGAIFQSVVATTLGAVVTHALGWSWESGVVFGLSLSVASTVVLTRVLMDNRALQTSTGHIAVGWLIVEDLFTVIVLVLLPLIFAEQSDGSNLWLAIGFALLKVAILVFCVLQLGNRIIPWLFAHVAKSASQELFTLTVLVTALGIAVCSAQIFNVSMALGAFLAGMVVGRSEFSLRAASEALPMRDAFAVLFFVSVGMLLEPSALLEAPGILFATLGVVVAGKALAALLIVLLLGYPIKVALGVAVALAQIGEFSFILSGVGKQLGLLNAVANNTIIATAIISITLNPILYRMIGPIEEKINDIPWLKKLLEFRAQRQLSRERELHYCEYPIPNHHAVIVGYGPIGKTVARVLKEHGVNSTIIELDFEVVRRMVAQGLAAVYGDACRREILEAANIRGAQFLILGSSSIRLPEEVIRNARELNPSIHITARTSYLRDLGKLKQAGCNRVYSGEGEVALALVSDILRGIHVEQYKIEEVRERIREELILSAIHIRT